MTRCKQRAHLLPTPFLTYFSLYALIFLLHSTSPTPAGYYPTLAPRLATIDRLFWMSYGQKTDKKAHKKAKKRWQNFWGTVFEPVSPGNEALDMPIHKSILHIVSMGYHIIFGGKGFGWFIGLRQAVLPKLTLTKLLSLICIFAFKPMIYRLKWFLYALEEGSNRPMFWRCCVSIYTGFKWILVLFFIVFLPIQSCNFQFS